MPRKSAAALSVVRLQPGQKRPEPPEELTAEEAEEWRAVVDRLPADWFPRESQQLLVQYCRHVVKARMIAASLRDFRQEWLETDEGLHRFDKLTQMGEREGRAISSLATRMRLTQQSRYRAEKVIPDKDKTPDRPWQKSARAS